MDSWDKLHASEPGVTDLETAAHGTGRLFVAEVPAENVCNYLFLPIYLLMNTVVAAENKETEDGAGLERWDARGGE
jgi:hypothetical protein